MLSDIHCLISTAIQDTLHPFPNAFLRRSDLIIRPHLTPAGRTTRLLTRQPDPDPRLCVCCVSLRLGHGHLLPAVREALPGSAGAAAAHGGARGRTELHLQRVQPHLPQPHRTQAPPALAHRSVGAGGGVCSSPFTYLRVHCFTAMVSVLFFHYHIPNHSHWPSL